MPSAKVLSFGPYRLIPAQRLLLKNEEPTPLGGRALDILIALVEQAGTILAKEQLLAAAWPDTHVHEANLRVQIGGIRKLLHDDGRQGAGFIISEPGRGYCFVAPVTASDETSLGQPHTRPDAEPASVTPHPPPTRSSTIVLTPIFGREKLIERIAEQLPRRRAITIVGPGGIGKTTVALAVAERIGRAFAHGSCFVDLAPLTNEAHVFSALATSLGFSSRSDHPVSDLASWLREKELLILFDNCDRVIDAVAPLVDAITTRAPRVHIVATSRESLRTRSEWIQRLPSLALPDPSSMLNAAEAMTYSAIQLFVERAGAAHDGFQISDVDAPIVAQICRKLDGLPLAIELAAGRIEAFGLRGVAALLDQRFALSKLRRRTATTRHQTLAATLDWSYETLPENEQASLRRLAIFAGAFTLELASSVLADSMLNSFEVVDCVANLVEKSLIAIVIGGDIPRYRLLETTHAYARRKLQESSEFDSVARKHAELFRNLLERAEIERERDPTGWLAIYRPEIDNVRSALDWAFSEQGDQETGINLTLAAVPLWTHLSLEVEFYDRVQTALSALRADDPDADRKRMRLGVALAGALITTQGGASEETGAAWSRVLTSAERSGDVHSQLRALWGSWSHWNLKGDCRSALGIAQRFMEIASTHSKENIPIADRMIGLSLFEMGQHNEARIRFERMLAHSPEMTDVVQFQFDQVALGLAQLAMVLWVQGYVDRARQTFEKGLKTAMTGDHTRSAVYILGQFGCQLSLLLGDVADAERKVEMLLGLIVSRKSFPRYQAWVECYHTVLRLRRGEGTSAREALARELKYLVTHSFNFGSALLFSELAQSLLVAGESNMAKKTCETPLRLMHQEVWAAPELLRVRGEIALNEGEPREAEAYFNQSIDLSRRQNALSWELRAACSFAALRRTQGRTKQAYETLMPVYGRFVEGFETSDLRAAKSLLDSLPYPADC